MAGDVERSINLYSETIESGAGKNRKWLRRKPGLSLFCTLPTGPLEGLFSIGNVAIAASGGTLYAIRPSSVPVYSSLGTIPRPANGNHYSFASNNNQILILPNDAAQSGWILPYTYGLLGAVNFGTLAQISSSGFTTGVTCCMVDGYFIANQGNNSTFQVSNLNDGTTWQSINQQSVNDYPDALTTVTNFLHYLQLFGTAHSECFYNTGSNSTIFARYEGSYQYVGIAAPWSVTYLDNSIFYLGQDERGQIVAYRLDGFTPKRISNYSFEQAVQGYTATSATATYLQGVSATVGNATAYSYQEDGHLFYVISFPTGNSADGTKNAGATWVYDVNEKEWHERAAWVKETSSPFQSHYAGDIARYHAYIPGSGALQLVGGGDGTGNVYVMSSGNDDDAGNPIRWLRRAPHLYAENVRNFYHQFILDMQFGSAQGTGQGSNPVVGLQYSPDGGQTWSSEIDAYTGEVGQYKHRVTWDSLGSGRDYVFQVFGSDPVPSLAISNAYLYLTQGIS